MNEKSEFKKVMGLISKKSFKAVVIFAFIFYISCLCYLLFFSYWYGRNNVYRGMNIIPLSTIKLYLSSHLNFRIIFTNIAGNVLAFLPMGFLLPLLSKKFEKFMYLLIAVFLSTLTIEIIQHLASVGAFDVDDMILNVLGGIIGYAIIKLFLRSVKKAGH